MVNKKRSEQQGGEAYPPRSEALNDSSYHLPPVTFPLAKLYADPSQNGKNKKKTLGTSKSAPALPRIKKDKHGKHGGSVSPSRRMPKCWSPDLRVTVDEALDMSVQDRYLHCKQASGAYAALTAKDRQDKEQYGNLEDDILDMFKKYDPDGARGPKTTQTNALRENTRKH